jgi:hypothetical protein
MFKATTLHRSQRLEFPPQRAYIRGIGAFRLVCLFVRSPGSRRSALQLKGFSARTSRVADV